MITQDYYKCKKCGFIYSKPSKRKGGMTCPCNSENMTRISQATFIKSSSAIRKRILKNIKPVVPCSYRDKHIEFGKDRS